MSELWRYIVRGEILMSSYDAPDISRNPRGSLLQRSWTAMAIGYGAVAKFSDEATDGRSSFRVEELKEVGGS